MLGTGWVVHRVDLTRDIAQRLFSRIVAAEVTELFFVYLLIDLCLTASFYETVRLAEYATNSSTGSTDCATTKEACKRGLRQTHLRVLSGIGVVHFHTVKNADAFLRDFNSAFH